MKRYFYSAALGAFLLNACATGGGEAAVEKKEEALSAAQTPAVERKDTVAKPAEEITAADFRRAVQTAVRNMMRSGTLDAGTDRYVVTVSHIVDTTKKGFDTAEIKRRVSADLAAGRKVRVVTAGTKNAVPQMNVSGRITQRTAYVRGGKRRQEYYLQLVLTDLKTGMMLWETVTPVVRKK